MSMKYSASFPIFLHYLGMVRDAKCIPIIFRLGRHGHIRRDGRSSRIALRVDQEELPERSGVHSSRREIQRGVGFCSSFSTSKGNYQLVCKILFLGWEFSFKIQSANIFNAFISNITWFLKTVEAFSIILSINGNTHPFRIIIFIKNQFSFRNWNTLFKIFFLSGNEHFQVRLDGPGSWAAAGLARTGGCRRGIRSSD